MMPGDRSDNIQYDYRPIDIDMVRLWTVYIYHYLVIITIFQLILPYIS